MMAGKLQNAKINMEQHGPYKFLFQGDPVFLSIVNLLGWMYIIFFAGKMATFFKVGLINASFWGRIVMSCFGSDPVIQSYPPEVSPNR